MKLAIVGAGVSGLSAGIYGLKSGFEVDIYEKNSIPGGCCSSWKRGEYTIDNCVHWLTGTKPGTPQYEIWKELGVIKDGDEFIKRKAFFTSEYEGIRVTLWRDIERTRRELIELAPEDEKEINRFIECVKWGESLQNPEDNPSEDDNEYKDVSYSVSRPELIKSLVSYAGLSLLDYSKKIKNPVLKKCVIDFMAPDYEALWLPMAYSFFIAENGDLPVGGSKSIVDRLVDTFTSLGGRLHLSTPVKNICVGDKKIKLERNIFAHGKENFSKLKNINTSVAKGIYLESGEVVEADNIICACDLHYTFYHLIDKKFRPHSVAKAYSKRKKNIMYSSFQVAFSVDGLMEEVDDTLYFDCEPLDVGMSKINRICVKNYRNYGDYIAPPGKTVIQCSIIQYRKDAGLWIKMHSDKDWYNKHKENVANAVLKRIETKFPRYEGKIKILDIWTPYTYRNRNNCHTGSYMRFITKVINPSVSISFEIKKLANVYVASHWLKYPGGLPTASAMGKIVVERIAKKYQK